jgi:hypothetical protein
MGSLVIETLGILFDRTNSNGLFVDGTPKCNIGSLAGITCNSGAAF